MANMEERRIGFAERRRGARIGRSRRLFVDLGIIGILLVASGPVAAIAGGDHGHGDGGHGDEQQVSPPAGLPSTDGGGDQAQVPSGDTGGTSSSGDPGDQPSQGSN